MLNQKILDDLKIAMKSRNVDVTGVLRMIIAALQNKVIEKRSRGLIEDLSDEEIISLLQKEVKKRREAEEMYRKGNRTDLAEKEKKELSIINKYLPDQLSREEIKTKVSEIISKNNIKDFNSAMKLVLAELKGKADGKIISEIIKKKIS
jgi:uncharacterized protein YqeY